MAFCIVLPHIAKASILYSQTDVSQQMSGTQYFVMPVNITGYTDYWLQLNWDGTGTGTFYVDFNLSGACPSGSIDSVHKSDLVTGINILHFHTSSPSNACASAGLFIGIDSSLQVMGNGSLIGLVMADTNEPNPFPQDFTTHFITVSPENGTTTATTSPLGASVYVNSDDIKAFSYGRLHIHGFQNSAFACMNSGAVYDAVYRCSGSNAPIPPFDYDFGTTTLTQYVSGRYDLTNLFTFLGGGKWNIEYDIQGVSSPWYYLGLHHTYTTIVSTTTQVTIGQLSPMDIVQIAVSSSTSQINKITQQGIGSILASTTASLASSCNIISGGFNMGDCLTLIVWPGTQAIGDDFTIIRQLPPWGYVFRMIDILNATTSTTTLPAIDYTFASTSPMAVIGDIHFDPFKSISDSGALVGEMKSDREDSQTVWQIVMPVVNIFVYLVLGMMVIHDLTGVHKHDDRSITNKT